MRLNADIYHVAEALEKAEDYRNCEVSVWDTDAVMRGISDNERAIRNIGWEHDDETVCSLQWNGGAIELMFHESVVENEFFLQPAGKDAINPQQATLPENLGERLCIVVQQINYAYNLDKYMWDFVKVDAASIAHGGYLTDYEFTYEALV